MTSVSEELAADEQAKQQRERRLIELDDLRFLLRTPAAMRVVLRILDRAGPLRQTFDVQSERLSCLRAGERNVGLWLMSELVEASPDAAAAMLIDMQKPNRLDDSKP